jgi:hypothetical protein
MANIGIPSKDSIDVSRELSSLIFIDSMSDVRGRALNVNSSSYAASGDVSRHTLSNLGYPWSRTRAGSCSILRWGRADS